MSQQEAKKIIEDALTSGRNSLFEHEAKALLALFNIPVPKYVFIRNPKDGISAPDNMTYPVVLKAVSKDILHKTEAGAVKIGLNNKEELQNAYDEMIFDISDHYTTAIIEGFIIEEMAGKGVEVIVGGTIDAQFGPAVIFGIGGVTTELLKDVSFRLAPVSKEECLAMIKEIKEYPLLTGFRGSRPVNLDAISNVIMTLGNIMKEINSIKEIEINPLIAGHDMAIAVDARVILDTKLDPRNRR